jgi:hypothetical protein
MMRPLFSRDNVSRLDLLEEHVPTLFRCIEKEKSSTIAEGTWTGPVSLAALLPSLTLDSATELFLGQSTSTLQASLDGEDSHPGMEFYHAFERMVAVLGTRVPLRSFYWLYGTRELCSCVDTLHAFVFSAITVSDIAKKKKKKKKKRALPRHYMTFSMSSASGVAVAMERSGNKSLGFSPRDEVPLPH